MKLSDMTGDQFVRALCLLAEPLRRIAADEQVLSALDRFCAGADAPLAPVICAAAELLPLLLEKHGQDTFTVASVLTGKTPGELRAMNAPALCALIRRVWDEEIIAFFTCAGTAAPEKS